MHKQPSLSCSLAPVEGQSDFFLFMLILIFFLDIYTFFSSTRKAAFKNIICCLSNWAFLTVLSQTLSTKTHLYKFQIRRNGQEEVMETDELNYQEVRSPKILFFLQIKELGDLVQIKEGRSPKILFFK